MKKLFVILIAVYSFSFAQNQNYGAGLTLTEKTNISDILAAPDQYVGKRVLVEGKILDVCEHAGCWMEIEGDKAEEKIRVKVKDGEIVFPTEARGSNAVVEGEVYAIELDEEEAKEFFEHMAEEAGKKFDESTVTGPMTIYQIKGLGAEIALSAEEAEKE